MAYQLVELSLQNYARKITDVLPLQIGVGGLSPNDVTTLIVSVVVGAVTGTATITLEESVDGGSTWTTVPGTLASGTINAPGTYSIRVTELSGIISPAVRLVITAASGGVVYISRAYRTLSTGNNIIPRTAISLSTGAATEAKQDTIITAVDGIEAALATLNAVDFSTEAKQDTIIAAIDGIEAALAALNAVNFATEATLLKLREWPYATHDCFTVAWNSGTFTEVISYRTGGTSGTVVGTATSVFSDVNKSELVSTVYSPAKVV
jgi:hypothetical protein